MHTPRKAFSIRPAATLWALRGTVVLALSLGFALPGRTQSADSQPEALAKQRTTLFLKASHTPLAEMESEINHLARLSETCRMEHGSPACGIPETPIGSDKLEERYAYYLTRPVEAHLKGPRAKIDRRNWNPPGPPDSK